MPIIQNIEHPLSKVVLWRIEETENELIKSIHLEPFEQQQLNSMIGSKRRTQWLAVRNILQSKLGNKAVLAYESTGRPYLPENNQHVGISHSGLIAAVQFSEIQNCGIDIQELSPKMARLYPKFINPNEESFIQGNLFSDYLNLIWTLKEAVFKYYSEGVEFKNEMIVEPFVLSEAGNCTVVVVKNGSETRHHLHFRRIENYFLSYLL